MAHDLVGLLRAHLLGCDDAARLALADWCEEQGDEELAGVLRRGLELVAAVLPRDIGSWAHEYVRHYAKVSRWHSSREWAAAKAGTEQCGTPEFVALAGSYDDVMAAAEEYFRAAATDGE